MASNVVQFPVQSDIARAVQTDNTNLTNLGSQIVQLIQHINQLRQQLLADNSASKAQIMALLEQRKAGISALMESHHAALAQLRQKASQNHIAIDAQLPSVTLQGMGQLVDTSTIQNAITTEQAKLTALQTYYTNYQNAVAAGQAPPALPPGLESGAFGMSGTTLALLAATVVGVILFFKGK